MRTPRPGVAAAITRSCRQKGGGETRSVVKLQKEIGTWDTHDCLVGTWSLVVGYDSEGHVQDKSLAFRLGTRERFPHEYHF